jgi:hypothetical protein
LLYVSCTDDDRGECGGHGGSGDVAGIITQIPCRRKKPINLEECDINVQDVVDVDSTENIVTISASSKSTDQGRRYEYMVRTSKTGVVCVLLGNVPRTLTLHTVSFSQMNLERPRCCRTAYPLYVSCTKRDRGECGGDGGN